MSQQFSQSFLVKQESEEYKNQREERIRSIKNKLSAIPAKSTSDLHHNIFAGKQQTQVSTFSTRLSCREGDYSTGQVQASSQRNTAFELDDSRRSSFTMSSIDFNNKIGRHSARSGRELGELKLRRFQIDAARLILDRLIKLSYRGVFDKISDYAARYQQQSKYALTPASKDQAKIHKRTTHNGYLNQKENQSIEKISAQSNAIWPQERSSVSPRNRWSCRTSEREEDNHLWRSNSPDYLASSKNYFKNVKPNQKDTKTNQNDKWNANNNIWDIRSNSSNNKNNNSQTAVPENSKMCASVEDQMSKDKGILSSSPLSSVHTGKYPINEHIFNDNQSASLDARSKSVLTTAGSLNTIPKSFLESVSSSKKTQSQCSPSLGKALTQPAASNSSKTQHYSASQPYFLSQESEARPKALRGGGGGITNKAGQVDYNVLHAELEQKEVQSIERLKSDFQEIIKASFLEVLSHSRSGTEQSNEGEDRLAFKYKQSPIKSGRLYPGDQSLLNGAEIESIPCDDQELLERAMAGSSSDDKMLFCAAQLQMEELLFEQAIHSIKQGAAAVAAPDRNRKATVQGVNTGGHLNHGNQEQQEQEEEQQLEQQNLDQSLRSMKQMIFNGSFGAKRGEHHDLRQLAHDSSVAAAAGGDLCISKVEQFSFEQKDDGIHDEISVIQSRTGREDEDIANNNNNNPFLNVTAEEEEEQVEKKQRVTQEEHKHAERQWHSIMDSVLLSDSSPGISSQPVIVSMLLSALEAARLRQLKAVFLQILSSNREKQIYLNNYTSNHLNNNITNYFQLSPIPSQSSTSFQHPPPQQPQQFTGLCYSNQFSTIIEQANETSSDMPLPLSISASKLLESHFLLESRNFDNLVEPTSISQSHNSHTQQQQQQQQILSSQLCPLNQLEGRLSLLRHSPIAIETSFTVSENTPIVSPCRINKSVNIICNQQQHQLKLKQDREMDGSDGEGDTYQTNSQQMIISKALQLCQNILLRNAILQWKHALLPQSNIHQGLNMISNTNSSLHTYNNNHTTSNRKNQLHYLQLCLFVLNKAVLKAKKRELFRGLKLIELASWKRQAKEAARERFLLLTANLIASQQKNQLKEAFNQMVQIMKLEDKQTRMISRIIQRNKRHAFLLFFKRTKEHKAQELFITKGIKNILLMAAMVARKLADLQHAAFNKIILQATQQKQNTRLALTADTDKENRLNDSNHQQKEYKYQSVYAEKVGLLNFKVNFLNRRLTWLQERHNIRILQQAFWRISQKSRISQEIYKKKGYQPTAENNRNGDDKKTLKLNNSASSSSLSEKNTKINTNSVVLCVLLRAIATKKTQAFLSCAFSKLRSQAHAVQKQKRETRLVLAESSMQLIKCKLFVEILARLVKKHMVQIPFSEILKKKTLLKQSKTIITSITNNINNNSSSSMQSAQIPRKMIRQPQKATFIVPSSKVKKTPKKGNSEVQDPAVQHNVLQYAGGNGQDTADKTKTNNKKTNISQSQYISQKDRDLVCPLSPQPNSRSTVAADQTYSGARINQTQLEQSLSSSSRAKCITFGGSLSPSARENNQSDSNMPNANIRTNTSEFMHGSNQQKDESQGINYLDSHRNRHSSASALPYFKHNRTKSGGNIHNNAGGCSSQFQHGSLMMPQKQTVQSQIIPSAGNQFFLN